MKNLKVVFLLIILLVCSQVVTAQILPTLVLKAGLSSASMTNKNEFIKYSEISDNRFGYTLGVGAELPLNPFMRFETGLLYTQKGMKREIESVKLELSPTYLEVPLGLRVKATVAKIGVYGSLGTYLAYGVGGKAKGSIDGDIIEVSSSDNISWGSGKSDDIKPFDFGYNIGAGVIFGQLEAGLYTSGSFINIAPDKGFDEKMRNIVFGLMIGYRI